MTLHPPGLPSQILLAQQGQMQQKTQRYPVALSDRISVAHRAVFRHKKRLPRHVLQAQARVHTGSKRRRQKKDETAFSRILPCLSLHRALGRKWWPPWLLTQQKREPQKRYSAD